MFGYWQIDKYDWEYLLLDKEWMFLIDPNYKQNNGYNIYLVNQLEIITDQTTYMPRHKLSAAKGLCEKMMYSGEWKKYASVRRKGPSHESKNHSNSKREQRHLCTLRRPVLQEQSRLIHAEPNSQRAD